jgi:hypothetical protein
VIIVDRSDLECVSFLQRHQAIWSTDLNRNIEAIVKYRIEQAKEETEEIKAGAVDFFNRIKTHLNLKV